MNRRSCPRRSPPGPGISVASRRTALESIARDLNFYNVNWDFFPDGKAMVIDQGGTALPQLAVIQHWPEMVRAMGSAR